MDIIEKILANVEKTTKAVVQKSTDVVEITKVKLAIAGDESKLDDLIKETGRLVYDAYKTGTGDPGDVQEKCKEIEALSDEIVSKKNQLSRLRNLRRCPVCGTENDIDAVYCNRCGEKLPEVEVEIAPDMPGDPKDE